MNIKVIVAYDGTRYLGWQKTNAGPSIEGNLEKVLSQVLQQNISLQAASRTDAGVHARGQVVNFLLPKEHSLYRLQHSLNGLLPHDISILTMEEERENFHPTLHCIGKEYHYDICNTPSQLPFDRHYSWHIPFDLSISDMQSAAKDLVGRHDFSSFCNQRKLLDKDTTREIFKIDILPLSHGRWRISVHGDHFLYKMVRNIVGTLIYVGCGKLPPSLIDILQSKDRTQAGVTAPAHGLTLHRVFYSSTS